VRRITLGESQKLISLELDVSPSSIAALFLRAASTLDVHGALPLAIVIAVHAAYGATELSTGSSSIVVHLGKSITAVRVAIATDALRSLSPAERAIAQQLLAVDGPQKLPSSVCVADELLRIR